MVKQLRDQLTIDKENLMKVLKSVKLWTFFVAIAVIISSIHLINVLGPRPLVFAMIAGKFLIVGLFCRHIRVARRAMRNGSTPVVTKMFKVSIRSTVILIVLVLALAIFIGPKVGRKMHKKMKEMHERERRFNATHMP